MASRHKLGATEANFENVVDPGYRPCLISAQTVKCLALGHCLGAESDEAGERGDLDYRNPPLSPFVICQVGLVPVFVLYHHPPWAAGATAVV